MNDPTTFHNRLKIECVTPSRFRVIDRIDGNTKFESCHRKECEGYIAGAAEFYTIGWTDGGIQTCDEMIDSIESDCARRPSGLSEYAKRTAAENRKRAGEGGAA